MPSKKPTFIYHIPIELVPEVRAIAERKNLRATWWLRQVLEAAVKEERKNS